MVESLLKTKLKVNSRWDFKEKIAKRDEAIKGQLRGTVLVILVVVVMMVGGGEG